MQPHHLNRAKYNRLARLSIFCAMISLGGMVAVGIFVATHSWESFAGLALVAIVMYTVCGVTLVSGLGVLFAWRGFLNPLRRKETVVALLVNLLFVAGLWAAILTMKSRSERLRQETRRQARAAMTPDDHLRSAMHGSLRREAILGFLAQGADVNAQDRGMTPLMLAAWNLHLDGPATIRFLVECGADVNTRNTLGLSALHFAAKGGSLEAVEAFVDLGADVDGVTIRGESVLDMARKNRGDESKSIERFLLERMGRDE